MKSRYLLAACCLFLVSCVVTQPQQTPRKKLPPGTYEVFGKTYTTMDESLGYMEIGIASWYGKKFHGRLTSNGETYDMYKLTAAHKALPLPTLVQVTNLDNGKKVVLRVNDRGPFHDDRVIDLSYQAARQLGFADKGTAPVVVEALDEHNYPELAKPKTEPKQKDPSYYLQIGAFSNPEGAQRLLEQIRRLLLVTDHDVSARILQSELEAGFLNKVWIGPIATQQEEDEVARIIADAELGKPIKVVVE